MEAECFNCKETVEISEEKFYSTEIILCDDCLEKLEKVINDDNDMPY
jgi:hypothetical protein